MNLAGRPLFHTNFTMRLALIASFASAMLCASAATGLAGPDPVLWTEARSLFDQQKNTEAQTAFAALAAEEPQAPEGPFYLGLLALRRGDAEAAAKLLEKAVELNPSSAGYHLRLGDSYGMMAMKAGLFSKLGLAKKCKACYEKAVAVDPASVEARWCLMEYYKQAPGIAGGSLKHALAEAEAIVKVNPSAGRFARATVLVAQKKVAEAFAAYDGVLTAEPSDYAALNQFGQLAMLTNQRHDEGIRALERCLALPEAPHEPTHVHLYAMTGHLQEKKGDKMAARAAYTAALALDPNFTPAAEALKKLN